MCMFRSSNEVVPLWSSICSISVSSCPWPGCCPTTGWCPGWICPGWWWWWWCGWCGCCTGWCACGCCGWGGTWCGAPPPPPPPPPPAVPVPVPPPPAVPCRAGCCCCCCCMCCCCWALSVAISCPSPTEVCDEPGPLVVPPEPPVCIGSGPVPWWCDCQPLQIPGRERESESIGRNVSWKGLLRAFLVNAYPDRLAKTA